MSKNVSDQLVETLVDAGIQRIYAVTIVMLASAVAMFYTLAQG
jgi:hypothetical protein